MSDKDNVAQILETLTESKIKDAHFAKFVRDLISHLKEKQRKVLMRRFGLSGRKHSTLDSIGKEFGVTRERIRQIEAASLVKLRKIAKLDHNKSTFDKIRVIITGCGGAVKENILASELIADLAKEREDEIKKTLKFVLLLDEEVRAIPESDQTHAGWALSQYTAGMIGEIANAFSSILEARGEVMEDEALLTAIAQHEVAKKHAENVNPAFFKSAMELSRQLHPHGEGKRGLSSWSWVKPKTIRDKIFYILSKKGEPLHFSEIAKEIEKGAFDLKKVTVQTVHNELISDKRFVLVGRGLYGLTTWGFEAGTVEEVIEKIMRKASAPMAQKDIVEKVMEKKRVKKATILINLQSSKKFKRSKDGWMLVVE